MHAGKCSIHQALTYQQTQDVPLLNLIVWAASSLYTIRGCWPVIHSSEPYPVHFQFVFFVDKSTVLLKFVHLRENTQRPRDYGVDNSIPPALCNLRTLRILTFLEVPEPKSHIVEPRNDPNAGENGPLKPHMKYNMYQKSHALKLCPQCSGGAK